MNQIKKSKIDYFTFISNGKEVSRKNRLQIVISLSLPTIFAQFATVLMQNIDAAMVARIGANDSAAIGLVASTTWLFGGVCSAAAVGFIVQVAQHLGAKKEREAVTVLKTALIFVLLFSVFFALIGSCVSRQLPILLGGAPEICEKASGYFFVFVLALPIRSYNVLITGMLQSSGNMKVPSILNVLMCLLDIIFNAFFIFEMSEFNLFGLNFRIPGAGLGVVGAALGTALAELVIVCIMLYFLCNKTPVFSKHIKEAFQYNSSYVKKAVKISAPVVLENVVMTGAMIVSTRIVAPLGTVALAAHSLSITAESLCYMPGYGIGKAATTLVGQSIGAGRKELSMQLAKTTAFFGMAVMTISGAILFFSAPAILSFLSPDPEVQALGTFILRIEAFAEPLYAASIVASGALQGAGDTLLPCIMNFASMWVVRIPLSYLLATQFGLTGVWIAMALELTFRGCILLYRLFRGKWITKE